MRVLTRLEDLQLTVRMQRRIGGVRAGSEGITWHLGATGERLLRNLHGDTHRRRYSEPEADFVAHTLAKAELAVQLHEVSYGGTVELINLEAEPTNWKSFIGPLGTREWLKTDVYAVTATGDYEDHWFLEADRSSEHPPYVVRKAKVYQRYAATGVYQARHGLFPAVVWVVPDVTRQKALQTALASDRTIQSELFRVITTDAFSAFITAGDGDVAVSPDRPSTPDS